MRTQRGWLAHPAMKRWWEVCTPLQEALATRKPGEWWAMMQQNFLHGSVADSRLSRRRADRSRLKCATRSGKVER